jgi:hypothetical protein
MSVSSRGASGAGSGGAPAGEIKAIEASVAQIARTVERIIPRLTDMEVRDQRHADHLNTRISELQHNVGGASASSGGGEFLGGWFWIIVAEAILLGAYMLWSKMRSPKQMKLY